MLCLFARGFVIFLILACISFPFLMLFNAFRLVAAHFHTFSVSSWPVCEFFCCRSGVPRTVFYQDKSAHIWGAVAFISEGLFPHALPCMQRFSAFFRLCFSFLALENTQRKEAQRARQTETNQLVATHGGVTHKHAPCKGPSTKFFGNDSV